VKLPPVVSAEQWQKELDQIRAEEKRATRERDALAARRRRLSMVHIDKDYTFRGPQGDVRLVDLFEGRSQLLVYHFMFAPGVDGWPEAGCGGCSMFVDQVGHLAHLHARDTSFVLVSRAPLENLLRYQKRMGWQIPWYSSEKSDFGDDFGLSRADGETFGLSVFLRDGDTVYRTYFTTSRGVEALGPVWTLLDLTPLGRQETWEDTPEGRPQSEPYVWWDRHDEY
jgi:predicted dithiol-disulfide oxidoreductase (DUF899 family)